MKCRICRKEAQVSLRSHNAAFCRECYLSFFGRQLERGISKYQLCTKDEPILVALSGGKDSLALMLEMHLQGYTVTGLHLDLGIPESSTYARKTVEDFCAEHNLELMVIDFAHEGLAIPKVKEHIRRPICAVCGSLKRYFMNKTAMDHGFAALATGHNLDDEVARLMSNTLRWDSRFLSHQSPCLSAEEGFVRKIKPLWRLTEYETASYAFLQKIKYHTKPCPYSSGASFSVLKGFIHGIELAMPGRKLDFYQGFLQRGRPTFAAVCADEEALALKPCRVCGYPTSADALCSVCRIKERLRNEA